MELRDSSTFGASLEPRVWLGVLAGALIMMGAVHLGFRRRWHWLELIGISTIVAALALNAASVLWSSAQETPWDLLGDLAVVGLASALAVLMTRIHGAVWRLLIPIAMATAMLMAIAYLQFIFQGTGVRAGVLGGGPNVFGRNMATLAVLALWISQQQGTKAYAGGLTAVLAATMVLVSGSRGALLALLVSGLWLTWPIIASVKLSSIAKLLIPVALATWMYRALGISRLVEEVWLLRFVELTFDQRYSSGRGTLLRAGVGMWESAPFLGAGLGAYRHQWPDWGYPHNIFVHFYAESGMAGLLLTVGLITVFVKAFRKRSDSIYAISFGLFLVAFASAQFSGDTFDHRGVFVWSAFILSLEPHIGQRPGEGLAARSESAGAELGRGQRRKWRAYPN